MGRLLPKDASTLGCLLLEEGPEYGDHTRIVRCPRWPELFTLAQQNRRLQTVYRSIELLPNLRAYVRYL
jgi:hypothetical protein